MDNNVQAVKNGAGGGFREEIQTKTQEGRKSVRGV
jgi:hypothetical protein